MLTTGSHPLATPLSLFLTLLLRALRKETNLDQKRVIAICIERRPGTLNPQRPANLLRIGRVDDLALSIPPQQNANRIRESIYRTFI